jgi:hypothetical protein
MPSRISKSTLARGTAHGRRGDSIVAHSVVLSALAIGCAGLACGSAASPLPVEGEDATDRVVTLDVECGPGAPSSHDAAESPGGVCTPSTPATPTKCLAMDVRDGEEGCNAGQSGWFYMGNGCERIECCSGTQCGRSSLTDTRADCEERYEDCRAWQAGELTAACVGLEVWQAPSCMGGTPRDYAWTGRACAQVGCCRGRDCDQLTESHECAIRNQACHASAPLRETCIGENPAPAASTPELDEACARCSADGGVDCAAPDLIGSDAALCIARATGLPLGLSPARTRLGYHYEYQRVVWYLSVTSMVWGGGESGSTLSLDARTGLVLQGPDAYVTSR